MSAPSTTADRVPNPFMTTVESDGTLLYHGSRYHAPVLKDHVGKRAFMEGRADGILYFAVAGVNGFVRVFPEGTEPFPPAPGSFCEWNTKAGMVEA